MLPSPYFLSQRSGLHYFVPNLTCDGLRHILFRVRGLLLQVTFWNAAYPFNCFHYHFALRNGMLREPSGVEGTGFPL